MRLPATNNAFLDDYFGAQAARMGPSLAEFPALGRGDQRVGRNQISRPWPHAPPIAARSPTPKQTPALATAPNPQNRLETHLGKAWAISVVQADDVIGALPGRYF